MNLKVAINYFKTEFNVSTTNWLLLILLAIDIIFLLLNAYNTLIPDEKWSSRLALVNDDSYSEMFQYLKWFLISFFLVFTAIKRSTFAYLAWALLFTYFLLDDALQIHERMGEYLTKDLTGEAPFGLRMQDIGELAISAMIGLILFSSLALAYFKSGNIFKKDSRDWLLLVAALIFFGVVIDTLPHMMNLSAGGKFLFGNIEDGGEMFVASFMLWFAAHNYLTNPDPGRSLINGLRPNSILKKAK